MVKVFFKNKNQEIGPIDARQLKTLVAEGRITRETVVWREGSSKRILAYLIPGLFPEEEQPVHFETAETEQSKLEQPLNPPEISEVDEFPVGDAQSDLNDFKPHSLTSAKGQAAKLLADLKGVNFKEEVIPVDQSLISTISKDSVFWIVSALAVIPILIATISRLEYQLTAFALFFAILWGVVFKTVIIRSKVSWKPLIASLFFTGIVGIQLLLFFSESVFPEVYISMASSKSGLTSLLGFIFQVGICEELVKIVPVVAYLLWKRKKADPIAAVLIGIFSGLGFAAFENMHYGENALSRTLFMTREAGYAGAVAGTYLAMVQVLLRSLSLVFCHAIWSGIFAYFITTGFAAGSRLAAMFIIGLSVSAVLHGAYDWLTGVQMTFAAFSIAGSFILFYAYLTKLKQLVTEPVQPDL